MKSQKGVTLVSLTIYIIALSVVMAIVALVSDFFYTNMNVNDVKVDPMIEYVKFNSFFTDEVNHKNLKVLECETTGEGTEKVSYIVFSNGNQYTFIGENKGIYYNKVKICRDIEDCDFSAKIENGKETITVNFEAGNMKKSNDYTISN